MQFYLLLALLTVVIFVMTIAVWLRTRTAAFVVGLGFIYYWTLFGAWRVVRERMNDSGDHPFTYLYYKMFPVYLDGDYALALVLYTGFIVAIQGAVIWLARPAKDAHVRVPVEISHGNILAICSAAYAASYLMIKDAMDLTADLNTSGYVLVSQLSPLWNLHSMLSALSAACVMLGMAIWFSGDQAKYMHGNSRWPALAGYIALLSIMFWVALRLGDRRSILIATLTGALFYFANAKRKSPGLIVAGSVVAVVLVVLPGITRDQYKMQDWQRKGLIQGLFSAVTDSGSSAESVAAHFSMYGVVHYHVPITWGGSLIPLIASVVPSFLWPDRPPDAYAYYAKSVDAIEGQGYTIHHATGWYVNFGALGVFVGGFVAGLVWAGLFNAMNGVAPKRSHFRKVLATMSFWTFTGYIPAFVRIPIEGYKAVLVESILAPCLVMALASVHLVLLRGRPALVPFRNYTSLKLTLASE